MTTADRIEKVQQLITDNEYGPDSPIVQLLEICRGQEEQINTLIELADNLIEQIVSMQASGGNTEARVSHLERHVEDMKNSIDWLTANTQRNF